MSDNNTNYNEDSIDSLGILGGVRAKPASIGLENHNHTFIEILANAIDEYREGYGKKIIIIKHEDTSISIQDFGRSVPMDKNSKGEYAYQKVFNELWSGGKYNNNNKESSNYLFSLGTNGCGATGTNYTSDFFECTAVNPNRYKYYIRYEKGKQVADLKKEKHSENYSGTSIHWLPSREVFRGENNISSKFINDILQQQSIINKGLKFKFIDKYLDEIHEYYYENGIIDFINEIGNNTSFSNIMNFITEASGKDNSKSDEYKIKCQIVFCFNNEVNYMQYFHNSSCLINGGTPETFIKKAFTYSIDKYIKDNNLYKKSEKQINFDDIKESLIIISNTFSTISLFTDQTKKCIDSTFMQDYMTTYLKEQLNIYFTENKIEADKIANQILINKRANEKANETKLSIKKKLAEINNTKVKIEGLTDCDMKNSKVEDRWLLVVEGKSPKSTVVDAFDNKYMGALGLRGRFISCLKKSVNEVLSNTPAFTFVKALGCGIEIPAEERKQFKDIKSFNKENLRYGNIGILTDADCWGSGIRLALLVFIYKYLKTLLKENRVYIIISPRYEIKMKNDEILYAYNEREKQELMSTINEKDIYNIGLVKGLGEINKDDFWNKVLCPEVREKTFIQVKYDEVDEIVNKYFEDYMGEDSSPRKDFVKKFITNVDLENIN